MPCRPVRGGHARAGPVVIYFDTSALGALFFGEPTAPTILQCLESLDDGELCTSAWTLAEMASVGAIKERTSYRCRGAGGRISRFPPLRCRCTDADRSRTHRLPHRGGTAGHSPFGLACGRRLASGRRPPLASSPGDLGCPPVSGGRTLWPGAFSAYVLMVTWRCRTCRRRRRIDHDSVRFVPQRTLCELMP